MKIERIMPGSDISVCWTCRAVLHGEEAVKLHTCSGKSTPNNRWWLRIQRPNGSYQVVEADLLNELLALLPETAPRLMPTFTANDINFLNAAIAHYGGSPKGKAAESLRDRIKPYVV